MCADSRTYLSEKNQKLENLTQLNPYKNNNNNKRYCQTAFGQRLSRNQLKGYRKY